jgi:hypothetical protein
MANEERIAKLQQALDRKQSEGTRAQAEEVQRFLLSEPSGPVVDQIWRRLVTGLLILIGLFGAALVTLLILDKPTDALLPIVTALISLLAGLFINTSGEST